MKLNVNYGLVDTEGVYLALPYKFSKTPVHGSRYSDVDASAILTARAVYYDAARTSTVALERALAQIVDRSRAKRIVAEATKAQRFMLYAVLVALRQVLHFEKEKVVSFVDVLGIASAFVAFSGTMAFDLRLPKVTDGRAKHIPGTGVLKLVPDEAGKRLVKRHIVGADLVPCAGVHDEERAEKAVAILQEAHKRHKDKLVVVDASGEFGVIQHVFLDGARKIVDGKLEEGTGFVYYEHRHSRGTDAKLDSDATGYVVVDWNTTTLTAAAQAMYRLRGIDYGRQKVVFLVCGIETAPTGTELYARLGENERRRNERVEKYAKLHVLRAETEIGTKGSRFEFERMIDEEMVESTQQQQQQQEQQQAQAQEQQQVRMNGCVHVHDVHGLHQGLDPLETYSGSAYVGMRAGTSKLLSDLRKAQVHVSPLLMFYEQFPSELEHAFAVMRSGVIVLCALVEVWARKKVDRRETLLGAYSSGGVLLRGTEASADEVLFGRYLCSDSLVHEDQVSLLTYLRERNRRSVRELHAVIKCLTNAGLVRAHSGLLRALFASDEWHTVPLGDPPPDLVFVEEVMGKKKSSFGRRFV